MKERTEIKINVPVLARVEGEGALDLAIRDNVITDLELRIFEPPRFFEKFLEGRSYTEVADAVARICGICPVAYQMSAIHAIEAICGVTATPWVRDMRRVFYCGEWIESHSLHIHLLAAPDFLGYSSAPAMAREHAQALRRGLRLQALGNDLIRLFGGRSVHPVGACVGGFFKAPAPDQVAALLSRLCAAVAEAAELVRWTAGLERPDSRQSFTSVSLRHGHEYPMNEGRIVSSAGLDIEIADFENHFQEQHVPHSTALHCLLAGDDYLVGPLARLNNNLDQLPATVQEILTETDISWPSNNMFDSIVARAIEIYYALLEAIRLLESYALPQSAHAEVTPTAGVGYGCTEAPRGILWHRYELDTQGDVIAAKIVPPTSQNQARIESDLRASLTAFGLQRDAQDLRRFAETVIRNYDPCISCATHFLDLRVTRR